MTEIDKFDVFNSARARFLRFIARKYLSDIPCENLSLIIVTHLLPDRPVFIETLSRHFGIQHVIAIPYSTNELVAGWVSQRFPLWRPTLSELQDGEGLRKIVHTKGDNKAILAEIGGYGAGLLGGQDELAKSRILGVVEGTEAGLRAYQSISAPAVPVVCLSLSPVKDAEATLVGPACFFSTNVILRRLGYCNELRRACVLGYGRVGQSIAATLSANGISTSVFDPNPERRLAALSAGLSVPSREEGLRQADIVFGAAGKLSWTEADARHMRQQSFLVSCSSKDAEFEFAKLARTHGADRLVEGVHAIDIGGKRLNFLNEGAPINFRDGANAGPVLTLLQAEMVAAMGEIALRSLPPGIQAPSEAIRAAILKAWFEFYIDPISGWYRPGFTR